MSSKKELRKSLLPIRNRLESKYMAHASKKVAEKIKMLGLDSKDCNILIYYPFKSEMDPRYLLDALDGEFFLPRISYKTRTMDFYPYKKSDDLEENSLGIKEPYEKTEPLIPQESDIIIIPSLAIDIEGNRLGYGGGFYDRYLERYPKLIKVAINYEELLQKKALPMEEHDVVMDYVVTEKRIIIEDLRNF